MVFNAIELSHTTAPVKFTDVEPVLLSDETLRERKNSVLKAMARQEFDALIIYADKEHGGILNISPASFRDLKRGCC